MIQISETPFQVGGMVPQVRSLTVQGVKAPPAIIHESGSSKTGVAIQKTETPAALCFYFEAMNENSQPKPAYAFFVS
jgi:hypothetical protein